MNRNLLERIRRAVKEFEDLYFDTKLYVLVERKASEIPHVANDIEDALFECVSLTEKDIRENLPEEIRKELHEFCLYYIPKYAAITTDILVSGYLLGEDVSKIIEENKEYIKKFLEKLNRVIEKLDRYAGSEVVVEL